MLDSKQCEAFIAVVEAGSFDRAAATLCITPSAVTQRVQALENELGQLVLIRARPCVMTQAGQQLFEYLQQLRRLEQNLLHDLNSKRKQAFFHTIIATNADSLATWLLAGLKDVLIQEKITLEIVIDDQSHTYALLEKGTVNACISIESKAMKGCCSQYLGSMRYKMICTKQFQKQWFSKNVHRELLRKAPAIIFSQKDHIHFEFLEKNYGLLHGMYPYYLIPSSESFITAIQLGLGYGMVPEFQLESFAHDFIALSPNANIDIPLYWHHWSKQSAPLNILTKHIIDQAKLMLRQ